MFNKNLRLVGFNAAGLSSKLVSFEHLLKTLKPSIFFVQESKMRRQGKIRTESSNQYTIFELVRKNSAGGGLALGVLNELEPIWISEGNDDIEIQTVQISLAELQI